MEEAHVISDPAVMMGKPVIAGTRITVELILEELAGGRSADEIHDSFPRLPRGAVPAALAFAAVTPRPEYEEKIYTIELLRSIAEGERQIEAGEFYDHEEVVAELMEEFRGR